MHAEAGNIKAFDEAAARGFEVSNTNLNANFYYKVSCLHHGRFDEIKKIIKDVESNDTFAMGAVNNKTAYTHARAIQGIMNLKESEYLFALNAFLEISPEAVPDLGIYCSFGDIARYLVILAIISLTRDEIKSKILTGYPKQILSQSIQATKFIESFINANYEEFASNLEKLLDEWKNDIYVSSICSDVQNKVLGSALKQYLQPIQKVKIETIANTFQTKVDKVEEIVKRLILVKTLNFKIDLLNKVLVAKVVDPNDKDHLVKKATNLVGNYCFEKQFAVLKIGFNVLANARHKSKGSFDPHD